MGIDNVYASGLNVWMSGDMKTTVARYGGAGADADYPDEGRFVAGVVRALRRRRAEAAAKGESDEDNIAIFVLEAGARTVVGGEAKRVPMVDNGLTKLTGKLWLTSAPVASAHFVELSGTVDDDEHFTLVVDQLKLGDRPTLLFDPRPVSPVLRWYPEGLGNPDNCDVKAIHGTVSPEEVFDAIDYLYKERLQTPMGLPNGQSMWKDSRHLLPQRNAEAVVQSYLLVGLTMRFPFCRVLPEQSQIAGRTDIEIEESDAADSTIITKHTILELKVLRSRDASGRSVAPGTNKKWIRDGVRQAWIYRSRKSARWSALCCFDMRSEDAGDEACFESVRGMADRRDVQLRRWYLYASPEALRATLEES